MVATGLAVNEMPQPMARPHRGAEGGCITLQDSPSLAGFSNSTTMMMLRIDSISSTSEPWHETLSKVLIAGTSALLSCCCRQSNERVRQAPPDTTRELLARCDDGQGHSQSTQYQIYVIHEHFKCRLDGYNLHTQSPVAAASHAQAWGRERRTKAASRSHLICHAAKTCHRGIHAGTCRRA